MAGPSLNANLYAARRRKNGVAKALALAATSLHAQPSPAEHVLLHELAAQVSPDAQHATIAKLVAFGTRHTLSDTKSDTRGIGAARRWVW